MDINNFWENCVKCTEIVYPKKSELLRKTVIGLLPEFKKELFYEQTRHSIMFNEDFLAKVQASNDTITILESMHAGIHECLHAIAYRENNKEESIFITGFYRRSIINELEIGHNRFFNEFMTDYLAFDVMDRTLNVTLDKNEWLGLTYIKIITGLSSIVGMSALKKAYFEGKFDEFKRQLAKRRPNSNKILRALEFDPLAQSKPSEKEIENALVIIRA